MADKFLEVVNVSITSTAPANTRIILGLGRKEIAEIKQVSLQIRSSRSGVEFFLGVSTDPEEAGNLTVDEVRNSKNIIAIAAFEQTLNTNGVISTGFGRTGQIIPMPEPGISVAGDLALMQGNSDAGNQISLCQIWFIRRKEKPNERENLIMSRR